MKFIKVSEQAKIREACRKVAREYCPIYRAVILMPCYKCDKIRGGTDCQGNPVGERDRRIGIARQSAQAIYGMPSTIGYERKKNE
jgi:hypothetical protein